MSKFECKVSDSTRAMSRRGLRVWGKIRLAGGGPVVATLDDRPEAIVADVHFEDKSYRTLFLAEAKEEMRDKMISSYGEEMVAGFGEEMWISEYARQLSEQADEAHNAKVDQQTKD